MQSLSSFNPRSLLLSHQHHGLVTLFDANLKTTRHTTYMCASMTAKGLTTTISLVIQKRTRSDLFASLDCLDGRMQFPFCESFYAIVRELRIGASRNRKRRRADGRNERKKPAEVSAVSIQNRMERDSAPCE